MTNCDANFFGGEMIDWVNFLSWITGLTFPHLSKGGRADADLPKVFSQKRLKEIRL